MNNAIKNLLVSSWCYYLSLSKISLEVFWLVSLSESRAKKNQRKFEYKFIITLISSNM